MNNNLMSRKMMISRGKMAFGWNMLLYYNHDSCFGFVEREENLRRPKRIVSNFESIWQDSGVIVFVGTVEFGLHPFNKFKSKYDMSIHHQRIFLIKNASEPYFKSFIHRRFHFNLKSLTRVKHVQK